MTRESEGTGAPVDPSKVPTYAPKDDEPTTYEQRVERDRPAYPSLYCAVWPDLVPLARSLGYALMIHGSLSRDLDLVAVPWTEEATDPETLVRAIADKFGAWVGSADLKLERVHKPHGRMGAILVLGGHAVVDLSVMPRRGDTAPAPVVDEVARIIRDAMFPSCAGQDGFGIGYVLAARAVLARLALSSSPPPPPRAETGIPPSVFASLPPPRTIDQERTITPPSTCPTCGSERRGERGLVPAGPDHDECRDPWHKESHRADE